MTVTWQSSVVLDADFSQCYFFDGHSDDHAFEGIFFDRVGLLGRVTTHQTLLTVLRQFGALTFRVQVCDSEPDLIEADEIAEQSVVAGDRPGISGWDSELAPVPLVPGRAYRLRFSVAGAEAASAVPYLEPGQAHPESYVVQLWPAEVAPSNLVRQESPAGAYWHLSSFDERVWQDTRDVPESERLDAAIDLALDSYPAVRKRIASGRSDFVYTVRGATSRATHGLDISEQDYDARIIERAKA